MSDSVSKYYEQQEELQISKRRAAIRAESFRYSKRSRFNWRSKTFKILNGSCTNREKIINNRKIIDLIG